MERRSSPEEPPMASEPEIDSVAPPPDRRRRGRWWVRAVAYVVLGYVAWCVVLYLYQDKLIFPADMAPPAPPAFRMAGGEPVAFQAGVCMAAMDTARGSSPLNRVAG